jgi:hypothetical protein
MGAERQSGWERGSDAGNPAPLGIESGYKR